jgi:DNA-binding MarR family transcriptional regulator
MLTSGSPPPRPLLGLLLRLLNQHWTDEVDAALRAAGFDDLRPAHANVFPFVPPDGIQVSELAKLARVRKQTMAQTIEELERAGYVERRPDPNDRRARLIFLTPRGESVRPVGVTAGRRVEQHWAELTSSKEIEALRMSLQHLLMLLAGQPDDAPRHRKQ